MSYSNFRQSLFSSVTFRHATIRVAPQRGLLHASFMSPCGPAKAVNDCSRQSFSASTNEQKPVRKYVHLHGPVRPPYLSLESLWLRHSHPSGTLPSAWRPRGASASTNEQKLFCSLPFRHATAHGFRLPTCPSQCEIFIFQRVAKLSNP